MRAPTLCYMLLSIGIIDSVLGANATRCLSAQYKRGRWFTGGSFNCQYSKRLLGELFHDKWPATDNCRRRPDRWDHQVIIQQNNQGGKASCVFFSLKDATNTPCTWTNPVELENGDAHTGLKWYLPATPGDDACAACPDGMTCDGVNFHMPTTTTSSTQPVAKLKCKVGVVEVDHWCPAADPNTGKCPVVKRNNTGFISDVAASYPHGRTCSWPCGAPAPVNLNPLFTEEYKKLLAAGKNVWESLTGGRERAWLKCRSLCENDASCTAYTLGFKYFGCILSTQKQPCGDFKYSCHTPENGGTYWKTDANCGVNAALVKYTVKACREVDHSKSCPAAKPRTTTTTTTTTPTITPKLKCGVGVVEVDHWCPAVDPKTGKCPVVKRNNKGVISDVAASYPHGRTCSWPCGAPAPVNLNPLFTEEYKKLLAAGKNVWESLTGGRERAWLKCRSLCENDASCTAYTLGFKYFGCILSTQKQPCGDFKYSCHTPENGGTYWKTDANCGVNAALHRYTVKACREVDHSKSCLAAKPRTTTTTTTTTPTITAKLKCDVGVVEVDHWCPAVDPKTGKCPVVKRNNKGVISDVVASYPHGRTCSWPCGAPAPVNLNPLFTEEYKKLLAAGKTVHESLTGGRERAWLKCRSLCENDASCTAYTLGFKYFGCILSTQKQPCGDFKYSCHTPENGGTYWKTDANCGVNAALHRYTVKACREVDHSKSCLAAKPRTTTTTTTTATTTPTTTPTTKAPRTRKTCYSVGDPHFSSFSGARFDNHAVGWQTLYGKGGLKIEAEQAKWRSGTTGVAINRAYRVTYNGQVTQGNGGQMPANGGVMEFAIPAVKVTVQAADYRRLAWAVDKYIYNIFVTTAETDGAKGMCVGAPNAAPHRRRAMANAPFPTNPVVTKEQAVAACASLTEQSDNCEFDVRMANDLVAIDMIADNFKIVETTVKDLEPPMSTSATTSLLGVSSAGALETMSAVVTCLLVAVTV